MAKISLRIDDGTILIVAEILRRQRGAKSLPIEDAKAAITSAVSDLKNQSEAA